MSSKYATARYSSLYCLLSSAPLGMDECSTLLLYSLLHGCRQFQDYVLSRTDIEVLVLQLLRALYGCPQNTANHLYMLQVTTGGGGGAGEEGGGCTCYR